MRIITILAATAKATATLLGANASNLVERTDDSAPRVVQHEIQRRQIADPLAHDRNRLRKRQSGTVQASLQNEQTLYFMDLTMGTPAQDLRLHIDTGSSDLWVNVATSQLCAAQGNSCAVSGTYSANHSTTYQYLNSHFNISYVDGSGSYGDYATETVRFGGATLRQQQFGIGYQSSSQEGILGIGYPINEAAVAHDGGQAYSNVPVNLLKNGYVTSNAYSLWLNDLDASTGSILFGGVNTEKYTGLLRTVPVIREQGAYAEFIIAMTAVGANGTVGSISNNLAIPALLDSGSSLMYLPDDVFNSIINAVGAQYDSTQGAAFVNCNLANTAGTLDFTFSGATIRISMKEFVIVAGVSRGQPVCILGIGPAGGSTPVLGDTFLRSAYVVYDLSRNEISLAQTRFNSTSDHIVEITGSTGVPGATAVSNPVTSVTLAASNGARIGGNPTGVVSSGLALPTAAVGYGAAALGVVCAMAMAL